MTKAIFKSSGTMLFKVPNGAVILNDGVPCTCCAPDCTTCYTHFNPVVTNDLCSPFYNCAASDFATSLSAPGPVTNFKFSISGVAAGTYTSGSCFLPFDDTPSCAKQVADHTSFFNQDFFLGICTSPVEYNECIVKCLWDIPSGIVPPDTRWWTVEVNRLVMSLTPVHNGWLASVLMQSHLYKTTFFTNHTVSKTDAQICAQTPQYVANSSFNKSYALTKTKRAWLYDPAFCGDGTCNVETTNTACFASGDTLLPRPGGFNTADTCRMALDFSGVTVNVSAV